MAVSDDYKKLATDDVDMLMVLKYIENDLDINFNIQQGTTINMRCPHEVAQSKENVHETSSITKTSLSLKTNRIKCYNPQCPCNKPMDTIGLVGLFYNDLSFEGKVKKVLNIGGHEYHSEERDIPPEVKASILRTIYVQEKCEQLISGYEIIEENRNPNGRFETLYVEAAKYLLGRGIPKFVARKLKLGVGGGPSKVLKNNSKEALAEAKILNREKKFELMNKRILIPNINKGLVVGITGRALYDDNRRYLNVGDVKNLINIDYAKKHDMIFMFEGGLNGASYEAITGEDNFVTLQGASSFKKEFLLEIIKESAKFKENTEFIYVADNDAAGLYAARQVGMEILKLGFCLNVLVMPKRKNGSKVDLNDILQGYGKERANEIWNDLLKTAEPFIVFTIKEEINNLKGLNPLTLEIKKAKIIKKYLKLDFIDPIERWTLEQYFLLHGYPVTSEFFDYVDLKFSNKPKLSNNNLICFVGEIDKDLEQMLIETEKEFNVLDISTKTCIYDLDSSIEVTLITNSMYLFKTKKIYQILKKRGHTVKIHYSDKPITSLIEYVFAVSKSVEGKQVFQELIK